MKVFKSAWFGRFARKARISADAPWDAVERAEKGQIDAKHVLALTDAQLGELISSGQFEEVAKVG